MSGASQQSEGAGPRIVAVSKPRGKVHAVEVTCPDAIYDTYTRCGHEVTSHAGWERRDDAEINCGTCRHTISTEGTHDWRQK